MMTSSPGLKMLEKKLRLAFSFNLKKKSRKLDHQNGNYGLAKTYHFFTGYWSLTGEPVTG